MIWISLMDPGEHDAVRITRTPRIRERNRADLLRLVSLSSLIKLCALKFRRLQRAIARESVNRVIRVLSMQFHRAIVIYTKPVVTYTRRDFSVLHPPFSSFFFFYFIFIFRPSFCILSHAVNPVLYVRLSRIF